jgi:hypothetical protein
MWVNETELSGLDNVDNDANGGIDDIEVVIYAARSSRRLVTIQGWGGTTTGA